MLFALLFASTAEAAYLCDLTSTEVEDVIDYYDLDQSLQSIAPFVTAPLDCSKFGDLCDTYGQSAEAMLCSVWDDAVNHASPSTINANATAYGESLEVHGTYFTSGCGSKTQTNAHGSNLRRVTGKTFVLYTVVYNAIGGSTQAQKRTTTTSLWAKDTTGDVSVASQYESSGRASGTCAKGTTSGVDTDGYVQARKFAVPGGTTAQPPESALSDHGYTFTGGSVSAETCNWTTLWNDATCF